MLFLLSSTFVKLRVTAFVSPCQRSTLSNQGRSNIMTRKSSGSSNNGDIVVKREDTSWLGKLARECTNQVVSNLELEDGDVQANILTLFRVLLPSTLLSALSVALYPNLVAVLVNWKEVYTDGVVDVIGNDYSQFVQNVLVTCSLVFSILVGQTFYFLYQQQEKVFLALFQEVTEAKSLLEQVALVSSGRSTMYPDVLSAISKYVETDLKQLNALDPARSISIRPVDDPLERILYLTSVGIPNTHVYDSVKSLRQARSSRLGAMQPKLPELQLYVLRMLAILVLSSFPVCGSGSQFIGGDRLLEIQSVYFGIMVFGLSIILNIVSELWNPRGGAYNVDGVLSTMVLGLEEELVARQTSITTSIPKAPTGLETSSMQPNNDFNTNNSIPTNKKRRSVWNRLRSKQ